MGQILNVKPTGLHPDCGEKAFDQKNMGRGVWAMLG